MPDAATAVTATKLPSGAIVAFTGITGATSYRVISTPGNVSVTAAGSPITVAGLNNGTAYTFRVTAINLYGESVASAASNSVTPGLTGQQTYTAGIYSFVVPPGITSVSVVCVGGGAGSGDGAYGGGAGGGLRYKNNITVTPGQLIAIRAAGQTSFGRAGASGNSSFGTSGVDAFYFYAGGGDGSIGGSISYPILGGTGTTIGSGADGGGNGGASSSSMGGGGAGGYSGNGGDGGVNGAGSAGLGGGGGGGAGWDPNQVWSPRNNGHGGGVGILGRSTNGAGGSGTSHGAAETSKNGQGGSGGTTAATLSSGGGSYGGGGGGSYGYSNYGPGGAGAVRIIYPATGAITRSFPITNTGNL